MPSILKMNRTIKHNLDLAHEHALYASGCKKVKVGALIVNSRGRITAVGANVCVPNYCQTAKGCRRVELYGEDSKNHRLPSDCRAVHSEINAIVNAEGDTVRATIYITRYPCEACARVICLSGITHVIYGREQEISQETYDIFESSGVFVSWAKEWTAPDTTR